MFRCTFESPAPTVCKFDLLVFADGMETECIVCLETYEAEGEKCTKLLPCSHTVCVWGGGGKRQLSLSQAFKERVQLK